MTEAKSSGTRDALCADTILFGEFCAGLPAGIRRKTPCVPDLRRAVFICDLAPSGRRSKNGNRSCASHYVPLILTVAGSRLRAKGWIERLTIAELQSC